MKTNCKKTTPDRLLSIFCDYGYFSYFKKNRLIIENSYWKRISISWKEYDQHYEYYIEEYHPLFLIGLPVGYLIVSFLFSRQLKPLIIGVST